MSNIEKLKDTPSKRSSPRLSAIKAAALKQQQQQRRTSGSTGSDVIFNDPYGPATAARDVFRKPTGLVYDAFMAEHFNPWDPNHVEKPARLLESYSRCQQLGLVERCEPIPTRMATDEELMLIHSAKHLEDLKELVQLVSNPETLEEAKIRCISNYQGVYVNEKTFDCTRMAAAAAIDLVEGIMKGELTNGLALVRPPGHHAMKCEFNGFCLCNNVAIAAKNAIQNLGAERVLIVDFDAHHGQATQRLFYDNPQVLYISIHRYENGLFWPNLRESNYDAVGSQQGRGFNVNVPLNEIGCGDAEYMSIFHQIILPMAYEYSPDLVLVSAGFDAAFGCPEGCMRIMPATYGHMINALSTLAHGRVAVVLEGGYFVPTVAEGTAMCLRALLGDYCLDIGKLPQPKDTLVESILNVVSVLKQFWSYLTIQHQFESGQGVTEDGDVRRYRPYILFRGDEVEPDNQYLTKVYDPKFHYSQHSEERMAQLMSEFLAIQSGYENNLASHRVRTHRLAVVYDEAMMRHKNIAEPGHPEQPARIERIFECLKDFGIIDRKDVIHLPSRRATDEEILLIHDDSHLDFLKSIPSKEQKELNKMAERLDSIYLNPDSLDCALLSGGSLLSLVDAVCQNEVEKGLAVIRPPGHHAECDEANGFCLINNVAMAAKYALQTHDVKRILVVDWDVHHGNGIQNMFYDDPHVLYISLHRYDHGTFFPGKPDANFDFVGSGAGEGFNVNIPWNGAGMGDAEYTLALMNVILPIAYQFNPELVLVSSGFDAAWGDPLGKCKVTPEMYGHMTKHLQALANGKIIVALEGGYNLNSISYAMTLCAKALVGDPLPPVAPKLPKSSAKDSIRGVIQQLSKYWSCLRYNVALFDDIRQEDIPGILPEATSMVSSSTSVSATSSAADSTYIPGQYGIASNTSGICTVTSSRHFNMDDQMSVTKDYYGSHTTATEAMSITMSNVTLDGDPPRRTSAATTDYIPNQYGGYASSSHIYTFSSALSSSPSTTMTSKSARRTDESSANED